MHKQLLAALLTILSLSLSTCSLPEEELSLTCSYTFGPKAGAIEHHPFGNPTTVGSPCTDGRGSYGFAVSDDTQPTPIPPNPGPTPIPPNPGPNPTPGIFFTFANPVRGLWLVGQGPPCPDPTNHHCNSPTNRDALDLVPLSPVGQILDCTGVLMYSPIGGQVITVVDSIPDLPPNVLSSGTPNVIVIAMDDGRFLQMVHIQQGSALVTVGSRINTGDPIARCGHNGISTAPHLHVAVLNPSQTQTMLMEFTQISVIDKITGNCVRRNNYIVQKNDILCD